jgi:hypothetical protein
VSYESEDRYWTDYLRVALPVIGLLLMLALFWWWAQQFIGDDGGAGDLAQATQSAIVATAPAPTPTNTVAVDIVATEGADPSQTPADGGSGNNGQDDGTPGSGDNQENCGFENGDQVVVTSNGVRLRSEPVVSEDTFIAELDEGVTLRIIEDCFVEDEDGLQWWRVRNEETSRTGYVAGEYLAAADDEE